MVGDSQAHVRDELVGAERAVMLRERHPDRELRAHVAHELRLLLADAAVQVAHFPLARKVRRQGLRGGAAGRCSAEQ